MLGKTKLKVLEFVGIIERLFSRRPMGNWEWVTPNICVGAGLGDIDIDSLAGEGVDVIIDMRAEAVDDIVRCSQKGIGYFWYQTHDSTDDSFEKALPSVIASGGRFLSLGAKLYIHCASGIHRGPHAACAIIMAYFSLPYELAWKRIKAMRPEADVQNTFVEAIKRYFKE